MTVPTVVNGKVYVGAEYALSVYGNGLFLPAACDFAQWRAFSPMVVTITLTGAPGASLYYTLDGTAPSSASLLYTGPFVLNASANLQVIAIESGAVNSGIASASFVNTAASGSGNGLQAAILLRPADDLYAASTLVRTDAGVDFNWDGAAPSLRFPPTNFTVRWTGSVEPQYSENLYVLRHYRGRRAPMDQWPGIDQSMERSARSRNGAAQSPSRPSSFTTLSWIMSINSTPAQAATVLEQPFDDFGSHPASAALSRHQSAADRRLDCALPPAPAPPPRPA